MLSLPALQEHFKNSIFENASDTLDSYICENGLAAKQRLQIYRNNVFITLTKALQAIYPAIKQLVGEAFFKGVAREYITQHPSNAISLCGFGHSFADFLTYFPPIQALPYLPDVACLEWAYHEVYGERDNAPFDLDRLKTLSEEKYAEIKFKLLSASRLLASQFPILQIWQICQVKNNNDEEKVELAKEGEEILIIRRQFEIMFEKVTVGEFALLSAFSRGEKFKEACALALQIEPGFDIDSCLQKRLLDNTIVDFYL